MSPAPWTHLNPRYGDFDADLAMLRFERVAVHEGDRDAKLRFLISVEGGHARRLDRIAIAPQEAS